MKKLVLLAVVTSLLFSSCPVLSLLGLGGDDKDQDQVELRLNLNGGTGTAATVLKFNPGQTTTAPPRPTGWTYTGYQFIGWNTAANGSGDGFQPGDQITMLGNITLYAQWRALGHPYSITNLKTDLNGLTARMLVVSRDYDILGVIGREEPPDDILAFGHAVINSRILAGNLWKYEGWVDDPDPDDPNMLPWQPTAGTEYDVYILVEFTQDAPELITGVGSNLGTSTIYPLKPTPTDYFSGSMSSWTLATSITTSPNVAYLKMNQGHSFTVSNFAGEWNGETAFVMVFPGDFILADAFGSDEPPELSAIGYGQIASGGLTSTLFQAPSWDDMDNFTGSGQPPWFPARDETYQVVVMLQDWFMLFLGEGTDIGATPIVINSLADGLTQTTAPWVISMTGAVGIDMDSRSGQKYKVSGFNSQYTDQTAIMLVLESPVDWAAVMSSGESGPPEGFVAFGWRWVDEDGTVYGGLYEFFPEIWEAFDTGGWDDNSSWEPWYPDSDYDYAVVMILPEQGLVFFGPETYIPYGEEDPAPMVVNPLGLMDGAAARWRLSAIDAVTMDMGGGDNGGGDQEPLVLTGVSGLYTESRTIYGNPNITNEHGHLDLNYIGHPSVDGAKVMQVVYELPNWDTDSFPWLHLGYDRHCDVSAVDYFVFSLDTSGIPTLHNLSIIFWSGQESWVPTSLNLSDLTPQTVGDPYSTYRIALADMDGPSFNRQYLQVIAIGWPQDSTGADLSGTVYFDDIYFE